MTLFEGMFLLIFIIFIGWSYRLNLFIVELLKKIKIPEASVKSERITDDTLLRFDYAQRPPIEPGCYTPSGKEKLQDWEERERQELISDSERIFCGEEMGNER